MADLAIVGRADPVGMMNKWRADENNMAVQDLQIRNEELKLEDTQRKIAAQKQQQKDDVAPMPWEVVSMKFEGAGEQGSPAEFIHKVAMDNGLIDMSQGGEGTTSKRNNRQLLKVLSDPQMASKLSRTKVDYGRRKLDEAKQIMAKKPNDPNAVANLQRWSTYLTQALGADKDIQTGYETLMKQKGKQREDFTLSPGQRRFSGEGEMIASAPDEEDTQKGLSVELYNPKTKRTVKVRRGSDYYNQFLESGYQEGIPDRQSGGAGSTKQLSEYRQWYKEGSSEAMKRIFANKPEKQSEIKIFLDSLESGDMQTAQEMESNLTQAMTDEQYQIYQDNIKEFFNRQGVPQSIRDIFNKNVGAEGETELPDPAEYAGKTIRYPNGDRFKSDGTKWDKLNG